MKLELQINEKALPDPNPQLAQMGVAITPPLDETFWMVRVPVSSKQAVVGFPKFGTIGIGFQVEARDWNTNLPYQCETKEIYDHIKVNKGPGPRREDCIKAIRMIQAFATEMLEAKPNTEQVSDQEPDKDDVSCRCDNCTHQDLHSKLPPAKDLLQRLTLGGVFTDVECPLCGALCYPV